MDKYKPSNGTEGMIFQENWCEICQKDAAYRKNNMGPGCLIICDSMAYDVEDPRYPTQWVVDLRGQPMCLDFEPEKEKVRKPVDVVALAKKERKKMIAFGQLTFDMEE